VRLCATLNFCFRELLDDSPELQAAILAAADHNLQTLDDDETVV